jgi:DNA repair exonuclease SbcCD nuclease subunit
MGLGFLQIGDLHLGASLPQLPPDIASELRAAVRTVAEEAFAEVRRRDLALVLVPGDVYEHDGLDPDAQLRFLYGLADSVAPVPVVIAPGNHDPYGPDTPWTRVPAPANVVLFTGDALEQLPTPAGPVLGRAFQLGEQSRAPSWTAVRPSADELSVLVLHCSLLHCEDDRRHHKTIAPVTLGALEQSGVSYAALGHYHRRCSFKRNGGLALASYSGCPQGQGWDETGPKGYVIGALERDGAKLQFIEASPHRWRKEALKLPPDHAPDREEKLNTLLHELEQALQPGDALALDAAGRWPELEVPALTARLEALLARAWHSRRLDVSDILPVPPLVNPAAAPVVAEFLRRCDAASPSGAGTEAHELARYLGHRLLSGLGLPQELTA